MSQGGHSEPSTFIPEHSFTLKSYGWWLAGGPCGFSASPSDFSVSTSPFSLDFGTLDFGLGLDN